MVAVRGRRQEGDLAEALAAPERADEASVADHLRPTGLDHVEAVAADRPARRPSARGANSACSSPAPSCSIVAAGSAPSMRDRPQDLDVRVADAHPARRAGAAPASWRPRPPAPGGRRRRARARAPSPSMRSGASRPPSANPSVRIASKPANMRARTVSSVSRASIVKPPTSISALPTPTRPSRTIAAACSGTTPISASGAPNSAIPSPNQAARPPRRTSAEREERAEHAAGPDGRVQDADARVAGVEQVDGDDDGEHGQAAAREASGRAPSAGDQRQRAIAGDGREALEHRRGRSPRDGPPAAARRRGGATTTRPASSDAAAHAAKTAAGPLAASSDGRGQRAAERGERVQHPAHRVRARQVLRRLGQRGQQGRMRRPVQRHGDRGDDREAVRRRRRAAGRRRRPRHREHRGADDPDAGQDPLAADPVGQRREERREQRRRSPCGPR